MSILTELRARWPGFDCQQGMNFSLRHSVQTGSWAHPASYPMGTGGSTPEGVKRQGREADHSPPSSSKVKMHGAIPTRLHLHLYTNPSWPWAGVTFILHGRCVKEGVSSFVDNVFCLDLLHPHVVALMWTRLDSNNETTQISSLSSIKMIDWRSSDIPELAHNWALRVAIDVRYLSCLLCEDVDTYCEVVMENVPATSRKRLYRLWY
jgi:hypothetical protein